MHTKRSALIGIAGAAALAAGCGGGTPQKRDRPASAKAPATRIAVVPNLVGAEQSQAHAIAARSGFVTRWSGFVGRLANGHTVVACAKVHSQSPVAGERRPRGASITILEIACHTPTGRFHDAAGVQE